MSAVLLVSAFTAGAALAQQSNVGRLKTKVNPGRAGVFVDGKYVGPAANFRVGRTYTIAAGEHEVKLVDPRYEEYVTKVTVQLGKKTVLREQLKPLAPPKPPFGTLRVKHADKFAAVYLNGKYFGHADEFSNGSQGMMLAPGEYDLRVEPLSGGTPFEQKVKIEANQTSVMQAR